MATKNQIIEELYRSKEFNDCISRMEPEHLRDDLKSEVMLILLETPDDKIELLWYRKELKFFTVRIIMNLIQSKTSLFYKRYRQQLAEITDRCTAEEQTDIEERAAREEMEDQVMSEIDNLYWYNSGIVKLYMKLGSFRAIEKEIGIPYASAYKTVKKSFNEIKQKVLG